ncbi:MAG TPA: MscL family protein, partial [Longimicrobiales bacterium]|nr:MscL family protein [Longimicrobiales bacterium]
GGADFTDLFVTLRQGAVPGPYFTLADAQAAGAVTINYGVFVNALMSFLIVAFAVFLLVRSFNKLRRAEATAPPPAPSPQEKLLGEIRDLLKARTTPLPVILLVAGSLLATPLAAQDAEGLTWEGTTELSFVATSGNASASTLGLKGSLTGTSGPNVFKLEVGGIRGENEFTTRTATGTTTSFTVTETTEARLTAESFYARSRYDRELGGAYGFAGLGWDRNTFAGVQNRYASVLGLGRTWFDGDAGRLKTDLGATFTVQKDVDPAPDADDAFAGVRLTVEAARRLTETVGYSSTLLVDENLEDTEDLRADWTHSLTVALSQSLAFKTSLQLLFDNQPALIPVPLSGAPAGTTVLVPSDELDTALTVALVITL